MTERTAVKLLATVLVCAAGLSGAALSADDDSWKIHPTKDPKSKYKVYVPVSLEDAFIELKKMLPPQAIEQMRAGSEEDMILYHDSLGRWLRNNWGLWGESRLYQYLYKLGLRHADDMSGLILDTFWCHLNSKPLRVQERVAEYQAYWRARAALAART